MNSGICNLDCCLLQAFVSIYWYLSNEFASYKKPMQWQLEVPMLGAHALEEVSSIHNILELQVHLQG